MHSKEETSRVLSINIGMTLHEFVDLLVWKKDSLEVQKVVKEILEDGLMVEYLDEGDVRKLNKVM